MSELGKGEHYESQGDGAQDAVLGQPGDEPGGSEGGQAFEGSDPDVDLITASPRSALDLDPQVFQLPPEEQPT
jgi:hypothetical protein